MPAIPHQTVEVRPRIGDLKTLLDGRAVSFEASSWTRADYPMPEALHVQQVKLYWKGAKLGDKGAMRVINPINAEGYINPVLEVALGATTIDVGDEALAAALAVGVALEFWSPDDAELEELLPVASAAGTVVTLGSPTTKAHTTGARLRSVMDTFCPCSGGDGLDNGLRLLGDHHDDIGSENEATEAIPAGLILGCRFASSSEAGTRQVVVNYRFRRPAADA